MDLTVPGSASVLADSVGLMLGVYYEPSGVRTVEEIRNFHGKEVVVIGRLHARTPSETHDGEQMQTMIGPYIDVETLKAGR